MKILNFGSCNIDYVYSLDHIVGVGETETTYMLETFPGGKGLNQSIAVAKAGVKVCHAGCVGCDGEILTNILMEHTLQIFGDFIYNHLLIELVNRIIKVLKQLLM